MSSPQTAAPPPNRSRQLLEGSQFYPTGYIVAGLPDEEQALSLCELFRASGYDEDECLVVPAERMVRACEQSARDRGVISALGSSGQVRERQLEMAQDGCHFLMVDAASEAEQQRVMRVLSRVPVRYAVHYHRFVIEDLIQKLPSATGDSASGRGV